MGFTQFSYQYDVHIESFLQQLGNPVHSLGGAKKQEVKLCCVLPGHKEKNPSLALNRVKGVFNCYGCGHGGGFKKFAELTGLSYEGSTASYYSDDDPFAQMLQGVKDTENDYYPEAVRNPEGPLREIPPGYVWRNLHGDFLTGLGAKFWYDDWYELERVWLPAMQQHEMVGWFARVRGDEEYQPYKDRVAKLSDDIHKIKHFLKKRKDKGTKDEKYNQAKEYLTTVLKKRAEAEVALDTIPKYYNNPNMAAKRILYPWDFVRKAFHHPRSIVLVEGQVDALALIAHNIPAVAILGTNNWSLFKESLIVSAGFKCVILAMDGDKSGRKAQKAIYKSLLPKVPILKRYRCPEGRDPGNLSERGYAKIAGMVI